jgi:hypothetical protein
MTFVDFIADSTGIRSGRRPSSPHCPLRAASLYIKHGKDEKTFAGRNRILCRQRGVAVRVESFIKYRCLA